MKNKKRKIAALALCVTLLVGLLATTFSSADDFKAPTDPVVLGGSGELTNIERIQSCYNSNLQTIVNNANLATGAVEFKILEVYPGEASTVIPETTFSSYVGAGLFASEVLTYGGVSVPEDMVDLTRVTAGTLCAQGNGSKEDILNYLKTFDLVYVNNTDNFKSGTEDMTDIETQTAEMFFKTYDLTEAGEKAFLDYATSESAPLLMDYSIYKYLNPTTLPGSVDPGTGVGINLKIAELAAVDFPSKLFSTAMTDTHNVFSLSDLDLSDTTSIMNYMTNSSYWKYLNFENKPTITTDDEGNTVVSTSSYKFLEIVPTMPEDGTLTPLQELAQEEATIEETYHEEVYDDEGNFVETVPYIHKVNRLTQAFLFTPEYGGTIDVTVCTPGSLPTDLSQYDAVFVNIGASDYDTLVANDITDLEKSALSEYASKHANELKYLYYRSSIGDTYDTSGEHGTVISAIDNAYDVIKNFINTTTNKSKYSNVVLVNFLFLGEDGDVIDSGDIATMQAMINTASYKGILPSSSDRKFNVLEIQPAAPVSFKTTDTSISQYYDGKNLATTMEERVYTSPEGNVFNFMFKPQGTINADGSFSYSGGKMLGVYTDGNGGYYFGRNTTQDFVVYESPALLVQSAAYNDLKKPVNDSDSSDLGIRPVYAQIEFRGETYSYSKIQYTSNSGGKYEVVYKNGATNKTLYISRYEVYFQHGSTTDNVTSTFYNEITTIGDPIKYVSHKAYKGWGYDNDFFIYELYQNDVTLNDGVNPSGPFTMYVATSSGYFFYEDANGNLYVFPGYAKGMYNQEGGFKRVNYSLTSETGIYSYHITKSKISDLIGIDASKINIDNYTVSELNCKVDDLVNTYDLIIIGGDVSALREFSNNVTLSSTKYYRKMEVDDKHAYDMYFHTGDITRRDKNYKDGSGGEFNVMIGSQKNEAGKYVYVTSGMDLSYTKQQELYNYINSGRPVLIESEVIDAGNNVSTRIEPNSYMGVMLYDIASKKAAGNYDSILTGFDYDDVKVVNGGYVYNEETKNKIINTINSKSSIIRPTLNIISAPIEYQDNLSKGAYGINGHTFSVEYNIGSEAGNNVEYEVNLYFDVDMDGRFTEDEIYGTQSYCTGKDKNKVMEYELVDTFFGILSWKLEATYKNNSATTQVSQLGYAGYDKASGEVESLKVLQIVPVRDVKHGQTTLAMCTKCDASGYVRDDHEHEFGIMKHTSAGNTGNLMNDFVFKDYFDIDLDIMASDKFCEMAYDNSKYYADLRGIAVANEDWLIDRYDMIVIGFADSYKAKDFTKIACAELIKFSEVNSLLCSHDNIGIINTGARYTNQLYSDIGGQMADPDLYKRTPVTSWSYNTSSYYDKNDPYYNSSVRYVYGAARFFTVDPTNPYENGKDGTEFYTDYGVDYGPAADYMAGIYGGQTDVCIGWRIAGDTSEAGKYGYDTSPYKNDGYTKYYNNTKNVRSTNDGIITRYPFALPERFTTNITHAQYTQLDLDVESTTVWYCLDSSSKSEYDSTPKTEDLNRASNLSYYTINPNDGRNSYYIYSNKNVTYTGAGHSDITPSFDNNYERKLFINTVFLSFNAMNNPPIIDVTGTDIDSSQAAKINTPDTKVDAKANVSSTEVNFEFDLKILDDLPDRYFTGLIYIDANPNGKGYDGKEDTLVAYIKYDKGSGDYVYYDLMKNGETRHMTGIELKTEYFNLDSVTHLSLQIYDRFPYSLNDIKNGTASSVFEEQRSAKSLNSIYTIRITASEDVEMELWDLN